MLVLSRKLHQRIRVGPRIVVTVLQVTRGRVRLGIEAPPEVAVWREELADGGERPSLRRRARSNARRS
jgi:carbon storage regulator